MILGDYRVEVVPDTEFRLDGGAMFGVVPRVLWEHVCPPDELNRIRQQMNCVFIDTGKDKILIETGIGEKWTEKETKMYGIFRERPFAETLLERTGCRPEEITIVINTHLHFDHAGGNTILTSGQASSLPDQTTAIAQFPNARYLVSRRELEHAENPHERDRASYLPENWRPMIETGQLEPMPDEFEAVPGLRFQTVRGHSETMQTWRLDRGGKTLYGFADLIPTHHHVPLPWIMGYDLYPTETLAFKKEGLPKAVQEGWLCLFYHDFEHPLCKLIASGDKIQAIPFLEDPT
ncbi:MAG: MBL fold metallo-hydrolase [Pyrinomonadaceae bacterium]|nr:MBL fold metallo-hydrolase [Pyrinomonadaceae bacterium]